MSETILAWYFATKEETLRYGDNRPIVVGETHTVEGKPELCNHGLHASERLIDALAYAPGPVLFRVELSGEMDKREDKIAASCRKYLQRIDATNILREFARKQALINIEKIKPYCSDEDYSAIIEWLTTGDDDARSAAWSAARSAAWSAAWSAANEMLTQMVEEVMNNAQ